MYFKVKVHFFTRACAKVLGWYLHDAKSRKKQLNYILVPRYCPYFSAGLVNFSFLFLLPVLLSTRQKNPSNCYTTKTPPYRTDPLYDIHVCSKHVCLTMCSRNTDACLSLFGTSTSKQSLKTCTGCIY